MLTGLADITEHRPCPYPLVYGYLRVARGGSRRKVLTSALRDYCVRHELHFGGMFADDVPSTEPDLVGFGGLLDVLAMPSVYGVVMPTGSHLGRGLIAAGRRDQIVRTGARLLLLRSGRSGGK